MPAWVLTPMTAITGVLRCATVRAWTLRSVVNLPPPIGPRLRLADLLASHPRLALVSRLVLARGAFAHDGMPRRPADLRTLDGVWRLPHLTLGYMICRSILASPSPHSWPGEIPHAMEGDASTVSTANSCTSTTRRNRWCSSDCCFLRLPGCNGSFRTGTGRAAERLDSN